MRTVWLTKWQYQLSESVIRMLKHPLSFQQSYVMQSTCSRKIQNHDHPMEGVTGYVWPAHDSARIHSCCLKCILKFAFKKTKHLSPVSTCPAPPWGETDCFPGPGLSLSCPSVRRCSHHHHFLNKLKRLCSLFTEIYFVDRNLHCVITPGMFSASLRKWKNLFRAQGNMVSSYLLLGRWSTT